MTSSAASDAQQYAQALRKSLMEDLFNGEELEGDDDDDAVLDITLHQSAGQLSDLDKEIEQFANHEVIKNILDKGFVLKEYTRDVDEKLRAVELESIQDYIHESDNLVALHDQVCLLQLLETMHVTTVILLQPQTATCKCTEHGPVCSPLPAAPTDQAL